ncbi:MAG: ATPase [Gammaproteobacteria bacterium]|nr:MAG: ATPase [Gammaproteobacteria bacterium]
MSDSEELFVGVDGGGTKCRACVYTSDLELLGSGLGGPSNPFHGEAQAQASIVEAIEMALVDAKLPVSTIANLIVGAGLAGVNVPAVFESMNAWQHPFKKFYLTTDLHVACLGAHDSDEGAVIVSGTGSCGYSYVNGTAIMIGGHGFLLGDKGSGAWLGLESVKAVLLAQDNLGPQTLLNKLISDYLNATGIMIVEKMSAAKSSDYAQLARFVFEAAHHGDDVATTILREGAVYIDALADRLWETNPGRMSIIGGLAEYLTPWLKPGVVTKLSPAINPPEFGAVYFARQQRLI